MSARTEFLVSHSSVAAQAQRASLRQCAPQCWQCSFSVQDGDPDIAAHFPQTRIVAGYVQLSWVEYLVEHCVPEQKVVGIADVKFRSQIQPPCEVLVELKIDQAQQGAYFRLLVGEEEKTLGQLRLSA